jgi:hypothetical protein
VSKRLAQELVVKDKVDILAGFGLTPSAFVLPKACDVLTAQDWREIAASFAENNESMQDIGSTNNEWFRQFLRRIVTLVPEPWGLGARS